MNILEAEDPRTDQKQIRRKQTVSLPLPKSRLMEQCLYVPTKQSAGLSALLLGPHDLGR